MADDILFDESAIVAHDCDHESDDCPHDPNDEWTDAEYDQLIYG